MRHWRFRRSVIQDERGATAVEFAIVSSVFFMLMLGIIEYGMIMYTKTVIESVVQQASRDVGIGKVVAGCPDRACSIRQLITQNTQDLIDPQSVFVNAKVVTNNAGATSPPVPDICLDNVNNPYPASCTIWQENGGGAGYQTAASLTGASIGVAGDIVEIRVTYLWRVLFPIFKSRFGQNGVLTITSSTVVKNDLFTAN